MTLVRRVARAVGLSGLAVVILAVAPASAGPAAAPRPTLTVRRVDSTSMPLVKVDVATGGAALAPAGFGLTENGKRAVGLTGASLRDAKTPVGTVLLLSTSASMNENNKMALERAAAKSIIQAKSPTELMAVVAYGGESRVVQDLTTDAAALSASIDRLAIGGTPSLFAGARMASALLTNRPDLLGNLIIVGDSGNTGTKPTASNAAADVEASQARTLAVGLKLGPTADTSELATLASVGRGRYFEAIDAAGVASAFDAVRADLSTQVELTFTSTLKKGASELVISAGGSSTTAQMVPGGIAIGAATSPAPVSVPQAPGPLRGKIGLLLIALLVLAGAGLFAYAIAALIGREDSNLSTALRPYQEAHSPDAEPAEGSLVSSAILQRAVDATERIADEQGLLAKVEFKLEQADLALRPAEAILLYGVGVLVLAIIAFIVKGPILGLVIAVIVGLVPPVGLNVMAKLRLRKFTSQLPDTLQLLSSSLRAGFSFMQGVEAVAAEVDDPMGSELRRVIVEARLGKPVEDALDDCASRMGSPDFDWAVMAVKIQREVGGNLAELLQTVAETMVERERLRRDVKSLTAEGRISAYILCVLPPALGVFFYISNPGYMRPLFNQTVGQIAIAVAAVAMGIGFIWMNKIISIEV